jgi:CRP-like cAMP-binding protein
MDKQRKVVMTTTSLTSDRKKSKINCLISRSLLLFVSYHFHVSYKYHIGDGKSFGEIALISNKPRGASILCKEDTHFAVMNRDDFRATLMKMEENVMRSYIEFLSKYFYMKLIQHIVYRKNTII